jgi:hypothetical protein
MRDPPLRTEMTARLAFEPKRQPLRVSPNFNSLPWFRWRRARKPLILREFIFWRRIFRNDVVLNNCAVAGFSLIFCWIVQC